MHWTARPTPPTSITADVGRDASTDPRTDAIIGRLTAPWPASRRAPDAATAQPSACADTAPDMTDRQRQRVGGVGGLGSLGEPEQPGDHRADLGLVGPAVTGDGGLDLARRVQRDRQPAPRRRGDNDAADLGDAHHGADVVLAEDPLDGDRVRLGGVQHRLDCRLDGHQPLRQGRIRGCLGHGHLDQRQRTPGGTVDHTEAAPGQTWVDAEHPH